MARDDATPRALGGAGSGRRGAGRSGFFRMLAETMTDYAIIMLDPEGKILTWSRGAEHIMGYKAEEITGRHFSCFYPKDRIESGLPEKDLQVTKSEGRLGDEGWRTRKDGSQFWAHVVLIALRDEGGNLAGFGHVTSDVTERKRAEEVIARQAQEILEVSTPVIQVWEGIIAAPLIGTLDSQRTEQFMERLLQRIVRTNSPIALIDITGVPTIDTQTAQYLVETMTAVRLLGAQVILTGVRPALAQTLVHLGIDLSHMVTRSSLAAGLRVAFDLLNLKVVSGNSRS
ncbi:MAG: PAS domain S-box protein [Candidatus Binatia bacterium]